MYGPAFHCLPRMGSQTLTPLPTGAQDTPGHYLASPSYPCPLTAPALCPSRTLSARTQRVGVKYAHSVASYSRHGPYARFNTTVVWWVASQGLCLSEVKPDPGSKLTLALDCILEDCTSALGWGNRLWEGEMPGLTSPDPALARACGIGPVTVRRGIPAFIRPK